MYEYYTVLYDITCINITLYNRLPIMCHNLIYRQLWFCGEVVTTCLLEKSIKMFPWIQFINLYSISEAHDIAALDLSNYYQLNQVRNIYLPWTAV